MTRVRRVEDWMAGQLEGSRRSRRSCWAVRGIVRLGLQGGGSTNVHVNFSGEESAGRRMDQEDAMEEIKG